MRDLRYSERWFPMVSGDDPEDDVLITRQQNVDHECESEACVGVTCPDQQFCYDMWRLYECR